jgi:lysyl-tRNA synthetase, class II
MLTPAIPEAPWPGTPPAASSPARADRTARAWSTLILLAGLLDLVSTLLRAGRARLALVHALVPWAVTSGATVLLAAVGLSLVLLAGGLRRHRRSAYLATVALLASSAVLHVAKSLDVGAALVEAFLAGLLVSRGDHFTARLGPDERPSALRTALAVPPITLAYGVAGLLANRGDVAADLGPRGLVAQAARIAVGLGASVPLTGRFGRAFPGSVVAVLATGTVFVVIRLLAPASVRSLPEPALRERVAEADDSLAYFALRDDRAVVHGGRALVSYRGVGTVALAGGDPLGPREDWPAAVREFLAAAAGQGRVAAVLGAGTAAAACWAHAGMRVIYLGDEAVLELATWSLEGRAVRIARQSWNRARRAGDTCEIARAGDLDQPTVAELEAISRRWRGEAVERGFSMALGRLFDPRDPAVLVVAGRDGQGRLRGFLHFVPWGRDGASLNAMRRDPDAPAILNDFLIVEAALRLPALGIRRLSLNFSFLRAVLEAGERSDAPLALRLQWRLLRQLSGPFQIESLYRFNRKFRPTWQPRYLALEALEDLPRVALAALRAEGLLARPLRVSAAHSAACPARPAHRSSPALVAAARPRAVRRRRS